MKVKELIEKLSKLDQERNKDKGRRLYTLRSMSQIATTIEQSKRLLNAGIDPESADMKHTRLVIKADGEGYFSIGTVEDFHIEAGNARFEDEVPAWSLSRLWDAFGLDILGGWFSLGSHRSEDVIEELVRMLENRHANH